MALARACLMDWQNAPCKVWPKGKTTGGYGKRKFRGHTMTAHRAEWLEKVGPIPDGLLVCHHCDNRPCYELTHLFLGTNADNLADMASKGRSTHGVRNNTTKLIPAQVAEIRAALGRGESQRVLGKRFNVCKSTIGYIARAETWQHWPERV